MRPMIRLGYCCINLSLQNKKVNRGMIKKTFQSKGLHYCSDLAIKNLEDTFDILNWNVKNNIFVYRMSSNIFPWFSEYSLEDLPNFTNIKQTLLKIGSFILSNNIRVGFHPGPFNVLCSENQNVVDKTIFELNQHSKILDLMGLPQTTYYGLNIHVNNSKPSKKSALSKFILNFSKLSHSCQKRLTIENDDKQALYTPIELIKLSEEIKKTYGYSLPVVFDNLHYKLHPDPLCHKYVIEQCKKTWGDITPLLHWSSSKKRFEDPDATELSHADYIYDKIDVPDFDFDVEFEAKKKDLAVFKYLNGV